MTIHRAALGEPVDTDLVFGLAGMALAAELSRTAWILSGKEHPLRMDRTAVRFVPRS